MIEILPIKPITPYFKVFITYNIPQSEFFRDIYTYKRNLSIQEIEKMFTLILALSKLKSLGNGINICSLLYKYEDAEKFGISKEEFNTLRKAMPYDGKICSDDIIPVGYKQGTTKAYFKGIEITYIDSNTAEHQVKLSNS